MLIGHSDTADLVLEDRFVSRRHTSVTIDPSGQVTILDVNSTGGPFVNGELLTRPSVLGDLVRFAELVARFEANGV
jgi:pSer/pThr/pTyr-binding forkhead associated (FHA) protein